MQDSKNRELVTGDRVKFVGLNPRRFETVGTFIGTIGGYASVEWDARQGTKSPLHPSQIEKIL